MISSVSRCNQLKEKSSQVHIDYFSYCCHFSCNTWTAICVALLLLSWSSRAFYSPIQGFLLYDPRWNLSSPTTGLCEKSPCSPFTPLAINWIAMCVALLLLNWYSRTFFSPIHGFLLHNPCENLSSPSTTLCARGDPGTAYHENHPGTLWDMETLTCFFLGNLKN